MLSLIAPVLAPQALPDNGWAGFEQPAVNGTERMGCDDSGRATLETSPDHWSINVRGNDEDRREKSYFDRIVIYVEMQNGRIEDVRSFTPDCKVEGSNGAKRIQLAPSMAVEWLDRAASVDEELRPRIVAAIAHIDHASAFDALVGWAEEGNDDDNDALFWLAQRRGDRGREVVRAHVGEDWPVEHRERAVMVLALSGHPQAVATVRAVARDAELAEVRARAVVALGITDAPGALADLHSIFLTDTDSGVREQAIFAMSQLENPEAANTLADIVREPRFGEHRRHALFWLANVEGEESEAVMDALVNDIF